MMWHVRSLLRDMKYSWQPVSQTIRMARFSPVIEQAVFSVTFFRDRRRLSGLHYGREVREGLEI